MWRCPRSALCDVAHDLPYVVLPMICLMWRCPRSALCGVAHDLPYVVLPTICLMWHCPRSALCGVAHDLPYVVLPTICLMWRCPRSAFSHFCLSSSPLASLTMQHDACSQAKKGNQCTSSFVALHFTAAPIIVAIALCM